jgi:PKD repeat protein
MNSSQNHRSRVRALAIGVGVSVALAVVPSTPALAFDTAQDRIVTDNPADWTPDVVSTGSVRYLAQTGNTMVAGGNFTQVRNHGAATTLTRNNIFSFDATTGIVNPSFAPNIDGLVHVVAIAPDGNSVFVGGEFKHVNGVPEVSLADVNLSTGAIVSSFKVPALDGRIFTMKLAGGRLYIGGSFAHVNGVARNGIAVLNPTTGAVDPAYAASFTGTNNPASPTIPLVIKLDISPDGQRLVAIGNFVQVDGQDRPQIAMFDLSGSALTLANWETDRYRASCAPVYQSYMHDVDFSPDGSYFVVGTTGGGFSGKDQSVGCDSASRWQTNATGTGLQPTWINFTGNDTIWSVAVTGTAVYTGGHNRWSNNAYGSDYAGPGAVDRPGLSALDPVTGVPFTWNPTRTRGVGVFDLLATSSGLWIGDDTDFVGHEYHHKMAFFPLTGGTPVPGAVTGSLPNQVYQLGTGLPSLGSSVGTCGQTSSPGSRDVVTRRLLDPSAHPAATAAVPVTTAGTAWNKVRGAFMISGTLFTGWPSGDLCTATFDGANIGPQQPLDLHNNMFINELSNVTAMFFTDNRLYYTKQGSNALFYRGFVPQSDILSAESHTAATNVLDFDLGDVSGMMLSGNQLYFVTRLDGTLHRTGWDGSAPVGLGTAVSGPLVDHINWTSAALFQYAGASAPAAPPQAPVAAQRATCTGLTCAFTGSGSQAQTGTITSYAWTFGDGSTSTQAAPSHTYSAAGTYPVKLTVTDSNGLTSTSTKSVAVAAPGAPAPASAAITFVGESHANASGTQWSVHVPANVQPGDALVLALGTSAVTPSAPSGAGWTPIDTVHAATLTSKAWSKVATASDTGSTVTITAPLPAKSAVELIAYRGTAAAPIRAVAASAETVVRSAHTTPTVLASGADRVLSIWAEKSSTTSSFSTPAALTARYQACGTGTAHLCMLVGDSNGPLGAGQAAGGLTANADTTGRAVAMWTFVLAAG